MSDPDAAAPGSAPGASAGLAIWKAAGQLIAQGRQREAVTRIHEALQCMRAEIGQADPAVLAPGQQLLAELQLQLGQLDEAAETARSLLPLLAPESDAQPAVQLCLARALHATGRLQEAAAAYLAVRSPGDCSSSALRGRALLVLQRRQLPRTPESVGMLRAALHDAAALAEPLLSGAERVAPAPDACAGDEWTPLHAAAALGDATLLQAVCAWLPAAAAAAHAVDGNQQTALHVCARHGNEPLARELLHLGADARAVTRDGYLAAHLAWARGMPRLALSLLPPNEGGEDAVFSFARDALLLALGELRDSCRAVAAFWAALLPARWATERWRLDVKLANGAFKALVKALNIAIAHGALRSRKAERAADAAHDWLSSAVHEPYPLLVTIACCWLLAARGPRRAARLAPLSALAASLLAAGVAWLPAALRWVVAAAATAALRDVVPAQQRSLRALRSPGGYGPALLLLLLPALGAVAWRLYEAIAEYAAAAADDDASAQPAEAVSAAELLELAAMTLRWPLLLLLRFSFRRVRGLHKRAVAAVLVASLALDAALLKAAGGLHLDPLRRQLRVLPMPLPRLAALVSHRAPAPDRLGLALRRNGTDAARLATVAGRVLGATAANAPSAMNLTVSLLDDGSKAVNAFATQYGHMFFYPQLVAAADDAALACVVGHEAAHALLAHGAEADFVAAFASDLLDGAACVALGFQCSLDRAGFFSDAFALRVRTWAVTAPLSQEREFEADLYGMYYASLAGYDAAACVALHQPGGLLLPGGETDEESSPLARQVALWTRSHPFAADRAATLRTWLPSLSSEGNGTNNKKKKDAKAKTLPWAVSAGSWSSPAPRLDASLGALGLVPVTSAGSGGFERRLRAVLLAHAVAVAAALELLARAHHDGTDCNLAGGLAPTPSLAAVGESAAAARSALAVAARRLPVVAVFAPPLLEVALDGLADSGGAVDSACALAPLAAFTLWFAHAPAWAACRFAWIAARRGAKVLRRRAWSRRNALSRQNSATAAAAAAAATAAPAEAAAEVKS